VAADFEFDQTRKGRQLKIANMVDEFTHEGVPARSPTRSMPTSS
jgi:hypothetical protein